MEIKGDLDSLGVFGLLSPILAHQSAKFELSGQFRFSRHPWDPGGIKVVELFVFEIYFSCFVDVVATWRKKFFSSN